MGDIQGLLRRFVKHIMGMSILNRWIVYFIDLFLCIIAYFVAVYMRSQVDLMHEIPNVVLWGGLFTLYNSISFYLFKSYKGLIRHTNFQELWRVFAALVSSSVAFYLTIRFFGC